MFQEQARRASRSETHFEKPTKGLKPVLIIDLDGTVRQPKVGKWIKPNNQELMDGVSYTLNSFRQAQSHYIVGLTNQGGVAHGFKSEEQVWAEIMETVGLFLNNPFHMIYAPTAEESGKGVWAFRSMLRKPNAGALGVI